MNDALEILDEIEDIINNKAWYSGDALFNAINDYVNQKRTEFAEPQGDCCSWNEDRMDVVGQNGNTGDHY